MALSNIRGFSVKDVDLDTGEPIEETGEEVLARTERARCEVCRKKEHKYRCPGCSKLTCSLECSKMHKEKSGCSGQKLHISKLKVKLQDYSLDLLRKDLDFLTGAIQLSNSAKKHSFDERLAKSSAPLDKKAKNLRHFLKKKRSITFKQCPSRQMARARLNTTALRTHVGKQEVEWTLELVFMRG